MRMVAPNAKRNSASRVLRKGCVEAESSSGACGNGLLLAKVFIGVFVRVFVAAVGLRYGRQRMIGQKNLAARASDDIDTVATKESAEVSGVQGVSDKIVALGLRPKSDETRVVDKHRGRAGCVRAILKIIFATVE